MNRAARKASNRAAGCEGKIPFRSWKHAERAATNQRKSHSGDLAPYRCPDCQRFHVGNSAAILQGRGVDPRKRYSVYASDASSKEVLVGYSDENDGGSVARRVIETPGWVVSRIVDRKPPLRQGAP